MTSKNIGKATLEYDGRKIEIPVIEGTMGEKALDIRKLRAQSGFITYDPGYVNTGSCCSNITYIDGDKGKLWYRGYSIEELAEHCSFLEVAYLLVHGFLPNKEEYAAFSNLMNQHSMLHEDMRHFFNLFPEHAHPMAMLSAMVVMLAAFYPELENNPNEAIDSMVTRLLSKLRTIAAVAYKKMKGHPIVYPKPELSYCENFLNMMFYTPVNGYVPDPVLNRALNTLLILHADHEQNCSSTVVKTVGSSDANLYASVAAGISALWGPKHGGANQSVIEMLEAIHRDPNFSIPRVIERAKDKDDPFKLMGFGHRVYKTFDPRAKIAKKVCYTVMEHTGSKDPLLDIALKLEEAALNDPYFQQRNLYPNVDFYTGLSYRAMGIPTNMFTVIFAMGRLPGWIAQYLEMRDGSEHKIFRPRQIYIGPEQRSLVKEE
ncbi:MAG: citrate synthase, partial [Victivallales bacterium]|nr:citrate synthase [Victivallales bacterium]